MNKKLVSPYQCLWLHEILTSLGEKPKMPSHIVPDGQQRWQASLYMSQPEFDNVP